MLALAVLVAAVTIQCSKSGGGNPPENGGDSTGVNPPKAVRQIVLAGQSVNRVAIADVDSNKVVWEWALHPILR